MTVEPLFTYYQTEPAEDWTIRHDLNKPYYELYVHTMGPEEAWDGKLTNFVPSLEFVGNNTVVAHCAKPRTGTAYVYRLSDVRV